MRRLVFAMCLSLLASACGLKQMLPVKPVLTAAEREEAFPGPAPSGVTYTKGPHVSFPVLPVQVWGATYDVDLVIVSKHPEWNMHEYAMLKTPDGPLWLAKDARESTMSQSVVADIDDIESWMPEIPLPRKSWPVQVVDASTEDWLDITISYENIDGEPVIAHYEGKPSHSLMKKRNGSTFGHSRDYVLVALDLSYRDFGKRASIEIGGQDYKIERLLGLVPFEMVLVQTQGGIAITDLTLTPGGVWEGEPSEREVLGAVPAEAGDAGGNEPATHPAGFTGTYTLANGHHVMTQWEVTKTADAVEAVQHAPLRDLVYHFRREGKAWELAWCEARQWGQDHVTTHVEFQPALPDLRRPFEGRYQGRFVMDINGQPNHAIGAVEAWWEDGGPVVELIPTEPWFVTDRPMRTKVTFEEGGARVVTERIPVEPE